jgi:hypothetical protein
LLKHSAAQPAADTVETIADAHGGLAMHANPAAGGDWSGFFTGPLQFDLVKMKTAPPVKLRDATMMYQPVSGSSPGSRYFVIAAGKGLRIGARYAQDSLSVRVEGKAFADYATKLTACGFTNVNANQAYASMHLTVPDGLLARKALGAILMGLGVALDTPLPSLEALKNLGA